MEEAGDKEDLILVARKPYNFYLKFDQIPFTLNFNLIHPDSDQIPYVTYNNEKGCVIESLRKDGIVNLDTEMGLEFRVFTIAMTSSWLKDAIMYELWVNSDGNSEHKIYYCDLPWPIEKLLYLKQVRLTKQLLGLTKENCFQREEEDNELGCSFPRSHTLYSSCFTRRHPFLVGTYWNTRTLC
ncbi:mitochondrial outer membrane import complex protein METAXIN-like [Impatiens glandulifera]|uniref:mitochondrial outer membrane import complex protein METAXIN-like n=1 Tax=Impatiens glandulifera TaxID=253017 RepID=UPI001FB16EBB|nr:mitochondrial outer membrane import complex protein METAXIN-like [Impatiens glandulifera]